MTTRIIYHNVAPGQACPDGLAAAWVALKVHPDAQLLGWMYQTDPPVIEPGDKIIIVDFSFSKAVLDGWAAMGCELVVIDHHKTAREMLEGFAGGILRFDMGSCGATLTWKYFFPDQPMPVFLRYVEDQDLWRWKLPGSKAVRAALHELGRSFELFDKLEHLSQEEFLEMMLPIGEPLVIENQLRVEKVASRYKWMNLVGYTIPVVKLEEDERPLRSDVCEWLYTHTPTLFSASYTIIGGRQAWDLRSDQNAAHKFNVSAIAKQYGGGGHEHAAGFSHALEVVTYDTRQEAEEASRQ